MKSLILLLFLCCTARSFAVRTIDTPPIRNNSIHGSRIHGAPSGCATADMTLDVPEEPAGSTNPGVRLAMHAVQIDFRNISSTTQTVRVEVDPTSEFVSAHSSPYNNSTPNLELIRSNLGGFSQPQPLTLGPGSSASYQIQIHTGTIAGQWVVKDNGAGNGVERTALGNSSLLVPPGCNPALAAVNCIALSTVMKFRIVVAEDRGAVLGNMISASHRCGGARDHYTTPPQTMPLNGGRPF